MPQSKTLIAYFSRTGNTKEVAQLIHAQVGGDLFAIQTKQPLPASFEEQKTEAQADQDANRRPALANQVPNFAEYDTIYIGTPTWDMALPQPVASFLTSYDLQGKTIFPFATNAGFGTGTLFNQIKELAPGATVKPSLTIKGGNEGAGQKLVITGDYQAEVNQQVSDWLTANQ
ncbi:flavodoxin [Fructilactobacillus myrtifloralis]|uniref:Flavodoxin n=1 Tax=Fructilactobacillus myrtifloralis TaxID=2940301 RepID=A0ABY5BQ61_9LACO|nr:flavodoxin [Fructilactobacillus myrtifloralis]USS84549.1 flavodoxin [Fructilactobacillus myrtifloralis]